MTGARDGRPSYRGPRRRLHRPPYGRPYRRLYRRPYARMTNYNKGKAISETDEHFIVFCKIKWAK